MINVTPIAFATAAEAASVAVAKK
nr:MAG: hypothetical protein [Bacteriophage sp.]